MTENECDLKAFSFISKISEIVDKDLNATASKTFKGSRANIEVADFSQFESSGPIIITQYFSDLSDRKISVLYNKIKYGFSESDCKEFYKFIYEINELKNLTNIVSIQYLKEKILLWIVDIHRLKLCKENLGNYLNRLLDEDINKYTFYYPILNIDIEEEFYIGDSKLTFFTKDYYDKFFEEKDLYFVSEDEFKDLYKKYKDRVFVVVEVKAERKLAQKLAYDKACYTVDVLKLTCPTVILPLEKCAIELESKIPSHYEYISFKNENKYDFTTYTHGNRQHHTVYEISTVKGFKSTFNQFGKLFESTSQIDILVKQSVSLFSKAISENDLHIRISLLIMIIESIFLKDDETVKMVAQCKKRFLLLSHVTEGDYQTKLKSILDNMYQIRHKMIHKSIRLYIAVDELKIFQMEIIQMLSIILSKSPPIADKNDFIDLLDN